MSEIKVGDRVKVTFDGAVTHVDDSGTSCLVERGGGSMPIVTWIPTGAVEKIEPPVEVFKIGDRVRAIDSPDIEFTIGTDGYLAHFKDRTEWKAWPGLFTSDEYSLAYRPEVGQ